MAKAEARIALGLAGTILGACVGGLLFVPLSVAAEGALTVRYRSATNVYLDGGRAAGLAVGERLAVRAGGDVVAEIEVVFLAEQSASCRVVSETRPVRVGDVAVRIEKGPRVEAPAEAPAPPPPAPPAPAVVSLTPPTAGSASRPWARLRGALALGYYRVWDQDPGTALDFQQRTLRLDATARDLGGRPLTFTFRLRSREDTRARSLSLDNPRSEKRDRLYELSLRYEPPSERIVFEVGRIATSRFLDLAYLDGVLARARIVGDLHLGGFFGKNVDVTGLGFGGSGTRYGAFLRLAPTDRLSSRFFEVNLAAIREFIQGDVSREYLSLESQWSRGSRFYAFERAELDLNRGWRRDLSASAYQLSTLSLSANYRASDVASVAVSYDDLKNYRSFFNRSLPENEFEKQLHEGLRGSVYLGRPTGLTLSGSGGIVFPGQGPGQQPGRAYSYGGGVRHGGLFGGRVSLGADASGYSNDYSQGYILTAQAGRHFPRGHSFELGYGNARYTLKATGDARVTQWLRATGRVDLTRGLAFSTDVEEDWGDDVKGPRGFVELGYRF